MGVILNDHDEGDEKGELEELLDYYKGLREKSVRPSWSMDWSGFDG
jgi:hypothetical protein